MATLTDFRGLNQADGAGVLTSASGAGGNAINNDFKTIVTWHPKSVWAESTDPTSDENTGDDF